MAALSEHVQHLLNDLDTVKVWIEALAREDQRRNLFLDIKRITDWLDAEHGCDLNRDALRIMKVGEEFGEAIQAWIGYTGQNPRKGVTHSLADVRDELADVAITALVAIESLGYNAQATLDERLAEVLTRVRV